MLNPLKLFKKDIKIKDTITHNLYINDKDMLKKILTNPHFMRLTITQEGHNLDITKEDGKYRHLKATYQHTPVDKDDKGKVLDLEGTIGIFKDYPITRSSITIKVPDSEKNTLIKAEKRYRTVKASGGRSLCKLQKFKEDEKAYCKLNAQLYSKRVGLSMDTRLTQLNLNTIVFGGSGAGKSRSFVEPNLLQANSSFVVTDPSGELLKKVGSYLESQGYIIKCLNIEKMEHSMRYNPFAYVKEDSDIPIMVEAMIANIEGPKKGGGGDNKFWDETSKTLLIALCGYLFETQPKEKQNFTNVLKLMDMADVSDNKDPNQPDDLDKLFADLEKADPTSYALSQWKVIKQAGTGKTAQNIMISTSAIFARFFRLDKIANLTYKDELHLEELGQRKCALFICTPQGDTTYNFLASELYTQLFDILYKQGEENASLKHSTSVAIDVPVRCMIDEAANVGVIPHLPEKVSTMRKYGISISLIYQNLAQMKSLMKDDWETIVGNCDTMLFLGGIDTSTVKIVSERLGKMTLNQKSSSINYGKQGGGSSSIQTTGRELLSTNEIEQMSNDKCILFIRSMKPFIDFKYPLEDHPHFKYSGDYSEDNVYTPDWYIKLDKKLLASLSVLKVDDDGYVPPSRREWVTEEDVKKVEEEQQKKKEQAEQAKKNSDPNRNDSPDGSSKTNELTEEEKQKREERMKAMAEMQAKKISDSGKENEDVDTFLERYKGQTEAEVLTKLQILGAYSPDYEFEEGSFDADLSLYYDESADSATKEDTATEDTSEAVAAEEDIGDDNIEDEVSNMDIDDETEDMSEDTGPDMENTYIPDTGFDETAGFDDSGIGEEEDPFSNNPDDPFGNEMESSAEVF